MQTTYDRIYTDVYDTYGQHDRHRTNSIIDKVTAPLLNAAGPQLVNEFAEWILAFEDQAPGTRDVTMHQIITQAKFAAGLPVAEGADYAADLDAHSATRRAVHRDSNTRPLFEFALRVVTLDDPRAVDLRATTSLSTIIGWAHEAIDNLY